MRPFSAFCAVGAISLLLVFTAEASEKKSRGRDASLNRPVPGAILLLAEQRHAVVPIPFFDNFESGTGGWTSDGFFNLIENPQNQRVLSPTISPTLVILPDAGFLPSAFSGTHAWWFGEVATGTFIGSDFNTIVQETLGGGTSVNPQTGSLISPPLDLTAAARARLSFRTWWEIEGVDVDLFDLMYVEVSVDGGVSFLPLGRGVINPLNDVDGEPWKSYSSGGLGLPGVWIGQLFDLTPYVGNILYLRFRFDTIDALYNGFRGWFIDDVSVTADFLAAPQITSIDPPVSFPGELISINGQNFVNGAVVTVGGEVASAVISTNLAVVQTPFLSAGQYDVTVTNPDGQSATASNGLTITADLPPTVDSITPDSAGAGSSIPVTILGSNFQPNATAEIGGIPLQNIQVVDPFTITGDSPSTLPVGVYNVRVTNPDSQFDQLISVFTVFAVSVAFGDPDGDGSVSAFDASLVLQHVVGLITLGSGAQLAADVDGDTFISAFDASLILQFVVGLRSCFPAEPGCTGLAKLEPASGSLGFAEPVVHRERVTLPVKLGGDVRNVTAVHFVVSFDPSLVSVDRTSFNLPEGWLSAHGVKDGHLQVAMAGSTLLPAGTLGTIQLKLANPEVALSLTGTGSFNSNPPEELAIVTIGQMPADYALYQNFPNPFNPSTTVVFYLPRDSRVSLKLYNLLGQEVMTMVSEEKKGGTHRVEVDLSSLGSNIYFYRLVAGTFTSTKKMVLLK